MKKALVVVLILAVVAVVAVLVWPKGADKGAEVVVYTALDRTFSEPILKGFERKTGIVVRPKYDEEATKTVGLTNAIRAENLRAHLVRLGFNPEPDGPGQRGFLFPSAGRHPQVVLLDYETAVGGADVWNWVTKG